MSSKGTSKRRVKDVEERGGKKKKVKRDEDPEEEASAEESEGGVEKDELEALDKSNIIHGGRRTRGIRVDYTKVEPIADEDDDDDDDEPPPRKQKASRKPVSKAKASPSREPKQVSVKPQARRAVRKVVEDDDEDEDEKTKVKESGDEKAKASENEDELSDDE